MKPSDTVNDGLPASPARALRILLLEDSRQDAQLIVASLEAGGLAVELERVDSDAAFNAALGSCQFDAILSDYHVPGFNGLSALNAARRACPQVPFVFVSGALGDDKAIELLKRGATDYVLKDRLERLVPSVERAIRDARERAARERAEALLRERERTLSTLMENLPGMAFRCAPTPPWHFEFASEGCFVLTGWKPEDFYAGGTVTWAAIMHPDDVTRVFEVAAAAFAERRQLTVTYRIRTQNHGERWVWDRSQASFDADGNLQYIEGFVSDITLQKLAEAEAQRRTDFEQQLIGIVSHDLRNPLHAISLCAETLLQRASLNAKDEDAVRRVRANAGRASRMIRDLLDFTQARLGGGIPVERKPSDLHAQAGQVLDELRRQHPQRSIEFLATGDARGEWDPDRIDQVIVNLVSNAIAYSPSDSPVKVHSRGEARAVRIEVHNCGPGIPAERLSNLFDPMTRGAGQMDTNTRSIGLGLFIVSSIVAGHGGQVTVSSSTESGTLFTVLLPRTARDS